MEEVIAFLGEEHSLEVFTEVNWNYRMPCGVFSSPPWPQRSSLASHFTPEDRGHQQPVAGDRLRPRHRASLHVLPVRREAERGPVRPSREAEEQDHRLQDGGEPTAEQRASERGGGRAGGGEATSTPSF